jgi:hypothetical protein
MDPVGAYQGLIDFIVDTTGATHSTLHVHAGLLIYLLAQVVLCERRGSWLAWNVTLGCEIANEVMNRLQFDSWRWDDTLSDVFLTMLWPTMLILVSQYRRYRWQSLEQRRARMQARLANMRLARHRRAALTAESNPSGS